jgi:hypothetical protein
MNTSNPNNSKTLVISTILVVDDDRALRLLMCKVFGFEVS